MKPTQTILSLLVSMSSALLFAKPSPAPVPKCQTLSKEALQKDNPKLAQKLDETIKLIAAQDSKKLRNLFHPRLKTSPDAIEKSFKSAESGYGKNWDVSVYRRWLLTYPAGKATFVPCPQDNLSVLTHYGYEQHHGIWLQLQADKELARIFLSFVEKDKEWYIGAFDIHQWTHKEIDYTGYFQKAEKSLAEKKNLQAFIYLDLADKLSNMEPFVKIVDRDIIQKKKGETLTLEKFKNATAKIAEPKALEYIATAFSADGAGLIVRYLVSLEDSFKSYKNSCIELARKFYEQAELSETNGLTCGFLLKGEPVDKNGKIGSYYVNRKEASEPIKN